MSVDLGCAAYGLFRLTFGINMMMRGIVRIALGLPAFQSLHADPVQERAGDAAGVSHAFATVLPYVETLIGLCVLLGYQTRTALIAGALMIAGLTFGTMMRQDFTIAWLQLDYALAFFILIALAFVEPDFGGRDDGRRQGVNSRSSARLTTYPDVNRR